MTEDEMINEVARRTNIHRITVRDIIVVLGALGDIEDEEENEKPAADDRMTVRECIVALRALGCIEDDDETEKPAAETGPAE